MSGGRKGSTSSPSPRLPQEHLALLAGLCSAQLCTKSRRTFSEVLLPPSNLRPKPSLSPGSRYTSTSSSGCAGSGPSASGGLAVPIERTVTKLSGAGATLTTVTNSSGASGRLASDSIGKPLTSATTLLRSGTRAIPSAGHPRRLRPSRSATNEF
jgi:hypothetical protein